VLALGTAVIFVGLLIKAVFVGVIGLVLAVIGLVGWGWRTEEDLTAGREGL
jgi:hypothetical protein